MARHKKEGRAFFVKLALYKKSIKFKYNMVIIQINLDIIWRSTKKRGGLFVKPSAVLQKGCKTGETSLALPHAFVFLA